MAQVAEFFRDGQTLMIGGFLNVGTPEPLIDLLVEKGVGNLTIIGNDTGYTGQGVGKLVANRPVRKVVASHVGTNKETGRLMHSGEMEVELVPQGTLAERIRAGGAGLGGVLTPTGVGTAAEDGKRKIEVDGRDFLLELPLRADVALLHAYKADKYGNLVYRLAARNFNPLMALAADVVVVLAENVVEIGELDPDEIVTPGAVVDVIVEAANKG
jgi:acetate CoA/acetoacetate CoA-transferase alpha subunit